MEFHNPVILNDPANPDKTADPYVICADGKYYHCFSSDTGIFVSEFPTLDAMGTAEARTVEVFHSDTLVHSFAPELHCLDGVWYIYAAPCYAGGDGNHFMCVYRSATDSPLGPYTCLGPIEGIGEKWSIDSTVFDYKGKRYMLYTDCKTIYLSEMASPTKLIGETIPLIRIEYDWEQVMSGIVEGPAVVFHDGIPYIVYSASDSKSDDYCLGLVRYIGGDLLNPSSWKKQSTPILSKKEGMYGPGHCSFTCANGETYCVFHANLESGSGWYGRHVFIKKVIFQDNTIVFPE